MVKVQLNISVSLNISEEKFKGLVENQLEGKEVIPHDLLNLQDNEIPRVRVTRIESGVRTLEGKVLNVHATVHASGEDRY